MIVNVAVIGVGLVGKEFISQLLALPYPSPFRLVYVSSSTRTHLSKQGLTAANWRSALANSSAKQDLANLLTELTVLTPHGRGRAVVVDNTSSDDVAAFYPEFLKAGIDVITPNKKAWSGELKLWQKIDLATKEGESKMLGEATVGAGLPIIGTLKDLVGTGDKILKIEGVLSGTLSYIFNEFSTVNGRGPSFSSVVRTAKEKGYTEPHPADDLTGSDVARKLTILSRHIPALAHLLSHGYKSVDTQSLVPPALEGISTGDEFLARLPEFDTHFDKLREDAARDGKVLRFVGVVDVPQKIIKASLEKYPVTHPFATSLAGSDNIFAFQTERYATRPLIVQGPGAGAAVTAAGVLGDLLHLM